MRLSHVKFGTSAISINVSTFWKGREKHGFSLPYGCWWRLWHKQRDLNERRFCFSQKTQKLGIIKCVVSLMADFVLLPKTSFRPGKPRPDKQLAKQGHSLVPQLPHANGAAFFYWSVPIMLFWNYNFCCFSVNRISSINHIYRLVGPHLLIIPLMLLNDQCKHVYAWQILFQKWALMAKIIF